MLNDTSPRMAWWLEPSEAHRFLMRARRCPPQPVLATRRLRLRAPSLSDIEHIETGSRKVAGNAQPQPARAQAEIGAQTLPTAWLNDGSIHWAVCLLETGALVGYISLEDIDRDHSQAELQFRIEPGMKCGAYAVEAGQAALACAFSRLGLLSVHAFSMRDPQSAHDALMGIGLRPLKHDSSARRSWGRCLEVQIWNITRHRWIRGLTAAT